MASAEFLFVDRVRALVSIVSHVRLVRLLAAFRMSVRFFHRIVVSVLVFLSLPVFFSSLFLLYSSSSLLLLNFVFGLRLFA